MFEVGQKVRILPGGVETCGTRDVEDGGVYEVEAVVRSASRLGWAAWVLNEFLVAVEDEQC